MRGLRERHRSASRASVPRSRSAPSRALSGRPTPRARTDMNRGSVASTRSRRRWSRPAARSVVRPRPALRPRPMTVARQRRRSRTSRRLAHRCRRPAPDADRRVRRPARSDMPPCSLQRRRTGRTPPAAGRARCSARVRRPCASARGAVQAQPRRRRTRRSGAPLLLSDSRPARLLPLIARLFRTRFQPRRRAPSPARASCRGARACLVSQAS